MRVEPVSHAPAKPQAAPTIIMPSTPRLRTPERSTTSSPQAAIRSGVEAEITVSRMASSRPICPPMDRANEADAVGDHGVAGEHEEQQNTLEHLGEVEWHLETDLRALAADECQREEQSGDQNADRTEASEEGDDDRGEAVTWRNAGLQMSDRAGHFDDAGQARKRA